MTVEKKALVVLLNECLYGRVIALRGRGTTYSKDTKKSLTVNPWQGPVLIIEDQRRVVH